MKVALFSGNYNYLREGANQALNRLVGYLERGLGYRVRVYSPVADTAAFPPEGTLVPVPSVRLPVRGEFRLALGLPRAIRHDLAGFAPDLVHVSTPDILGARAVGWARERGKPLVASLHTRFETYPAHYGIGWARPLVEAHLNRFYRRCDHVLAPSPVLVAEMAALLGPGRASLWSRGVDRAQFSPARRDPAWRRTHGIAADEAVLLFFGRLVLEKGVEEYAAAIHMLAARGLRVRPLVVGAGPAASAFADLPGLVMAGHLEGEALARAIASADMLLHPSTTETFGNVMLEAMASGLAVIAADTPVAAQLAEHGRAALLYPHGDPAALAEAAASLIADPPRRAALAAAGVVASAAYGWDEASGSVAKAYATVLDRRSAHPFGNS
jgi:glycosyltransferase involved in cell wall biosynthesis